MIGKKPNVGRDSFRKGTKIVPSEKAGRHCKPERQRTMKSLKKLLCPLGTKTDGDACKGCASVCAYGKEYRQRIADGEVE